MRMFCGNGWDSTDIVITPAMVPGEETGADLHMSLSDRKGNSAIIEIKGGQFKIHQNEKYRVMTNDPFYDQQLIIDKYWQWQWDMKEGGNKHASQTLPGTPFSDARFATASYYINHLDKDATQTSDDVVAQMFSIIYNASVPIGYASPNPGEPNVSSTLWSTVADHNRLNYYFKDTLTPNIFWTELEGFLDAEDNYLLPMKSDCCQQKYYAGCVNDKMVKARDFYHI